MVAVRNISHSNTRVADKFGIKAGTRNMMMNIKVRETE